MTTTTASTARTFVPSPAAHVSNEMSGAAGRSRLGLTRASLVLGLVWLALGVRLVLGVVGPKLSGDLTLPGLVFFVVTGVLASRIYARVANPAPTPEFDDTPNVPKSS